MAASKKVKALLAGACGIGLLGALVFAYWPQPANQARYIEPSGQTLLAQGKTIYANNCASCHGAQLQGQANWRLRLANGRLPAPPHDVSGHTWHHPDQVLVDIIRNGLLPGVTAPPGYVSDMPAYKDVLSDHDIVAVLAYIKSSWPRQALDAQKQMTEQWQKQNQ